VQDVGCIGYEFARSCAIIEVKVVERGADNNNDDSARISLPSAESGTMGQCASSLGYVVNACCGIFVQDGM